MNDRDDFAWDLYIELRKEIVASQGVRAQIIGFKITFVTATAGLIVAFKPSDGSSPNLSLLVIPAVAAVFFDFLIVSYSIGIKRLGHYCRHYLEPIVKGHARWPEGEHLWEAFMALPAVRQRFAYLGVIGLTSLAVVAACIGLFVTVAARYATPMVLALVVLFSFDAYAYVRQPARFSGEKIS